MMVYTTASASSRLDLYSKSFSDLDNILDKQHGTAESLISSRDLFSHKTLTSERHMGLPVYLVPFPIANGDIAKVKVTDAGVVPAENDLIKIQTAGVGISPSKIEPKKAHLSWVFEFITKKVLPITKVLIEEVAPSDQVKFIYMSTPKSIETVKWSGSPDTIEANIITAPWLYSDKATIYVFKFTIHIKDAEPVSLYQAAWFSTDAKTTFIRVIDKINERY